jgi:hypothetical protein
VWKGTFPIFSFPYSIKKRRRRGGGSGEREDFSFITVTGKNNSSMCFLKNKTSYPNKTRAFCILFLKIDDTFIRVFNLVV